MNSMFEKLFYDLRNLLYRAKNKRNTDGDGLSFYEDVRIPIKTHIIYELMTGDTVKQTCNFHNIVTQQASVLIQKLLAGYKDTKGASYFVLGIGDPFGAIPDNLNNGLPWECHNHPKAPVSGGRKHLSTGLPILVGELARKQLDTRQFLVSAQSRVVSNEPTHICAYKALFLEHEGNGPLMEFGLAGGNVLPDIEYIPSFQTDDRGVLLKDNEGRFIPYAGINRLISPGDLMTYKTHKLFYKTSGDRLRATYIIEMELNQAAPEAAAE